MGVTREPREPERYCQQVRSGCSGLFLPLSLFSSYTDVLLFETLYGLSDIHGPQNIDEIPASPCASWPTASPVDPRTRREARAAANGKLASTVYDTGLASLSRFHNAEDERERDCGQRAGPFS